MKRKYRISTGKETVEREYNYIPVRYIIAVLITLFEILAIIGMVVACCYYIPYFYIAAWLSVLFMIIGTLIMIPAYPIYRRISRNIKAELTPEILHLSEKIMNFTEN
ncbi:MAG: hypothetical protein IKB75_02695 [Clostridia bacterium]|nr:hypothetical protein [Clostridia bacterium]MBR2721667.1 hypothetical protein [Clostridia bacterium]